MKRTALLLTACASLAGCQPVRTRVCLTEAQSNRLGLELTGALATDSHGSVFLMTRGNIVRYDPGRHEIEHLLRQSHTRLVDLAVANDDVLLALGRSGLHAVFAGETVEVLELPGRGVNASCYGDHVYVLVRRPSGELGLIRYSFATKQIEPLMLTRQRISAISAVHGGCLVASGGSLYKLFVPAADGDSAAPREVHRVLLLAMAGKRIVSVAADRHAKFVYFASPKMTYAWANERVVPLFPMGGQIRYRDRALTIVSPDSRQVVQLVAPARRAEEMLKGASPGALPPADLANRSAR